MTALAELKARLGIQSFGCFDLSQMRACASVKVSNNEGIVEIPELSAVTCALKLNSMLTTLQLTCIDGLDDIDWQPLVDLVAASQTLRSLEYVRWHSNRGLWHVQPLLNRLTHPCAHTASEAIPRSSSLLHQQNSKRI
jgi:hypothetical protein